MTVHSDTTFESARCFHADGLLNHSSNLSQRVSVVIRLTLSIHHKLLGDTRRQSEKDLSNRQVRVNSLVRVAVLRSSQVLQVTPHIVGLVAQCSGTNTLSHSRSKLIHL